MEQWAGSLAVVTGSTSGIGAAIAEKLIGAGINVVGIGRRLELLEAMRDKLSSESVTFYPIKCDLTDEEQIFDTFRWIDETLGAITILVNNAGVLFPASALSDGDISCWKSIIDVNFYSYCICSREAIKSMKNHGIENGSIINISSISAHKIPAFLSLGMYAPMKTALHAVYKTLSYELRRENSKIRIMTITPGLTESDLYRDYPQEIVDKMGDANPIMKAGAIADGIEFILSQPANIHVEEIILRPAGEFL